MRASAIEVGRDVGRVGPAAVHAAEAAGRHEPDPGDPADGQRAARRSSRRQRRATTAAARSRGPALRAVASKRASSSSVRPTTTSPSSTPDRRRHGAAGAHGLLRGEPDLEAGPGREAVRDERRLERDDRPALLERRGDLLREPDHGSDPSRAQQRAAASRPSVDTADEVAGGERVAGARRVDDARSERRGSSTPSTLIAGRPALDDPAASRAPRSARARARSRRRASGRKRGDAPAEGRSSISVEGCEVDRDRRAMRTRELGRPQRRRGGGLARERVARDVQALAGEPRRVELVGRKARATEPRSEASERSPAELSETTTALRPSARAGELARRARRARRRADRPRASSPRLPTRQASAPEAAAQAATFAAWPPAPTRVVRLAVVAARGRRGERDDHVEGEVAETRRCARLRCSHAAATPSARTSGRTAR